MSKQKSIYLVAQYMMKPRDHVNTSVKGWMDNPDNIRYDENVQISKQLRTKDLNAQVVLDLSNKKVEKNAFHTNKTFDEIFEYFFVNYNQYVVQVMGALDPEYVEALVARLTEQMQQEEIEQAPVNSIPTGTIGSVVQDAIINEETQAK